MILRFTLAFALTLALPALSYSDSSVRISILSVLKPKRISITLISPEKTVLQSSSAQKVLNAKQTITVELKGATLVADQISGSRMRYCPDHSCAFRIEVGNQLRREYQGELTFTPGASAMNIVLQLSQQDFLASMAASEMGETRNLEALKAFTIVARSFLLAGRRHPSIDADLCDTTHCEVFQAFASTQEGARAVQETEGLVLTYKNTPFRPYYSRSCGGKTATFAEVWGEESPDYPFASVACPCRSEWSAKLTLEQLQLAFGVPIVQIQQRSNRIEISGVDQTISIFPEEFRSRIGRTSGWNLVPSNWFVLSKNSTNIEIHGKGIGHRIGFCQTGATMLASSGKNFPAILQYYFPNTEIRSRSKQ